MLGAKGIVDSLRLFLEFFKEVLLTLFDLGRTLVTEPKLFIGTLYVLLVIGLLGILPSYYLFNKLKTTGGQQNVAYTYNVRHMSTLYHGL